MSQIMELEALQAKIKLAIEALRRIENWPKLEPKHDITNWKELATRAIEAICK